MYVYIADTFFNVFLLIYIIIKKAKTNYYFQIFNYYTQIVCHANQQVMNLQKIYRHKEPTEQ